ncbi:predicted protein [Lichtheimia corymbifera JMRC:FSU:9682]|uniref:Uncharacterized protein n=1 Tax=Lichtheimia corymbifera JMRC:FSU:9682 TaxID=1263082 RepID=A0A068RTX7_9FUNG|nr:predicted protein [Lichtheimia corymbifera JMRC:FSU:9682]
MNKHHLPYSITLEAYVKHKCACISKLYNETWGLQSNNSARLGEAHLGCKFHDRRGQSRISQCHHQPRRKKFKRSTSDPLWPVVTLRNLGLAISIVKLGQHTLSTTTSTFVL